LANALLENARKTSKTMIEMILMDRRAFSMTRKVVEDIELSVPSMSETCAKKIGSVASASALVADARRSSITVTEMIPMDSRAFSKMKKVIEDIELSVCSMWETFVRRIGSAALANALVKGARRTSTVMAEMIPMKHKVSLMTRTTKEGTEPIHPFCATGI